MQRVDLKKKKKKTMETNKMRETRVKETTKGVRREKEKKHPVRMAHWALGMIVAAGLDWETWNGERFLLRISCFFMVPPSRPFPPPIPRPSRVSLTLPSHDPLPVSPLSHRPQHRMVIHVNLDDIHPSSSPIPLLDLLPPRCRHVHPQCWYRSIGKDDSLGRRSEGGGRKNKLSGAGGRNRGTFGGCC